MFVSIIHSYTFVLLLLLHWLKNYNIRGQAKYAPKFDLLSNLYIWKHLIKIKQRCPFCSLTTLEYWTENECHTFQVSKSHHHSTKMCLTLGYP